MVLAHNEEKHIAACLDSVFDGEPDRQIDVYVMANGCTDRTGEIVRLYRKQRSSVHLVSIALGDKCNAWNVFIHETIPRFCPDRRIYFFMDGDATITPGSLTALEEGLRRNPRAHAASAPPASGRSLKKDRLELIQQRGLVANLYALRGDFVRRLAAERVRLPLNLEGDDGLLGILIKWDLKPELAQIDDSRIEPCERAGFSFASVDWRKWSDWRNYWRRLIRYGRRAYEFQLLGPRLRSLGINGIPQDIRSLYVDSHRLRLRWQGVLTITNWIALQEMRKHANRNLSSKRLSQS